MLSWGCILCGYELHAQAVSLVQAQRTRPSMASDAQSLCHPRVGVHAAADAGQQGFGLLSAVSEAIPHARLARALETQSCPGSVGWPGLLRASSEPPYAGAGSHTSARRHATRYPRGIADTTRCRTVHSGSGGVDRKSTRLNSSHSSISYAVFCLKKKKYRLFTRHCTTNPPTARLSTK